MRKIAKLFIGFVGSVLLAGSSLLTAVAAPKLDTSVIVNDYADILSSKTEEHIAEVSNALYDACGAEIGVYTVDYIGNDTMENYAYEVFNKWQLGDADEDNGVLLLLVPGEDDYYITRGAGLETTLTVSMLGNILDNQLEEAWVNKEYDTGVTDTVDAIADRLCGIYHVELNSYTGNSSAYYDGYSNNSTGTVELFVIVIIIVIIILAVLFSARGGGYVTHAPRPYRRRRHYSSWSHGPYRPRPPVSHRPPSGSYHRPSSSHHSSGRSGGISRLGRGGGMSRGGGVGRRH